MRPSVIEYYVPDGKSTQKVNREEAEVTAALLVAASEQPEYADKTFGMISLVGIEQSEAVNLILEQRMRAPEFRRRRILCGNAATFQGDERDVMFLSVVDAPEERSVAFAER